MLPQPLSNGDAQIYGGGAIRLGECEANKHFTFTCILDFLFPSFDGSGHKFEIEVNNAENLSAAYALNYTKSRF